MQTKNGIKEIEKFYDDRYRKGYMEKWPPEQKERVSQLIKSLDLPDTGAALDFGCGNGEFTVVLKQALPGWNVTGVDISSVAIENAGERCPGCSFSLISEINSLDKKFDFLFSHHVLEHVSDIDKAWNEINQCVKRKCSILHIMPCGNEGSFEYKLCMLKTNGIENESGARFYFEDKSHLRRLTSDQMNKYAAQHGFDPGFNYFNNHFYGALNWITLESPSLIFSILRPSGTKDFISGIKLICLYCAFMLIKCLRFPANTIDHKRETMRSYQYYFLFLLLIIFYPFSKLMNIYLKYKAKQEWENKKGKSNGSEMYLYYKRT